VSGGKWGEKKGKEKSRRGEFELNCDSKFVGIEAPDNIW